MRVRSCDGNDSPTCWSPTWGEPATSDLALANFFPRVWNDEGVRRVVIAVVVIAGLLGLAVPAHAQTAPVDSLASSRIRTTTKLVGLAADVDGGRTDLSANGQFVILTVQAPG